MHGSYYLLNMPPFLLLAICLLLFGSTGAIGTYLFRKYVRIKYLRSHNEIVGYVFAILGGFYGLLLGFVVFFVWDSLNQAQNNASREGSLARGLYRDIRYYPDSNKVKPLMDSYLTYVHAVVEGEYPAMERLERFKGDYRASFNDVFRKMELLDPHDPRIEQMFRHLNDLATYRGLRQLDASSEIPIEIWVPLIVGAAIILLFAMLVDVESRSLHITVNALMGSFIGLVMFLIIIIDHPFTGTMKIRPEEYTTILEMARQGN